MSKKIKEKIKEEVKVVENPSEAPVEAVIEAQAEVKPGVDKIPPQFLKEFDDLDLPPVYSKGKPYKVIDGQYVALPDAEILILERKIAFYTAKLEYLKNQRDNK